jgi:TonB family protein
MTGELHFQAIPITLDFRQRTLFRFALAVSVFLHIAGFLTSPYWQPIPRAAEDIVTVDLADIPAEEMPKLPRMQIEEPTPDVPQAIRTPSPTVPKSPPPSREMIRKRVASRGLLKMLPKEKEGSGPVGDPLSGIKVPSDIRLPSKSTPVPADYRPSGSLDEDVAAVKRKNPGIGKQVAAAPKSSTVLASKIFFTDAGLEGEISGGIDDRNRSIGQIAATVKQYRSGIKYVYNKELITNPSLSGKLTVSFVIRPDGAVERPEIRQSSLNWPSLEKAVLKRMQHWKFPKSQGAPVRVTFPFVFHPEM